MAEEIQKATATNTRSASQVATVTTFREDQAAAATIKRAKFYVNEDLWVINVSYAGETYVLRFNSTALPIASTAEDIAAAVNTELVNNTPIRETAGEAVKAVAAEVKQTSYKKIIADRDNLKSNTLSFAAVNNGAPTSGVVFTYYNGYTDPKRIEQGYDKLDNYSKAAEVDITTISADKANPTTITLTPSKEYVASDVISIWIVATGEKGVNYKFLEYWKVATDEKTPGVLLLFNSSGVVSAQGTLILA
jgi:hypothetical protein